MYNLDDPEQLTQLLEEFKPDLIEARVTTRRRRPVLQSVLDDFLPIRPESLFLGVAVDGRPVLLTISDAQPGPLLIVGGGGAGKSSMLQVISRAIEIVDKPEDVQYGVITSHPDEWKSLGGAQNCVDIFPAYKDAAQDFVRSLDEWARSNHSGNQSVVLLIDDVTTIMRMDAEARQSFRWLLVRGPGRRVWPIAGLNPARAPEVNPWLPFFRTRLFGHVSRSEDLGDLSGTSRPPVEELRAGSEFFMRESGKWVKFWVPSVGLE